MKSIIFYTFIILLFHHVSSINFCKDCKYHKLVRSNNNYNDISDLCTAYGKPLSDDYVFISKLCNAEVNVDIEYMNCLDARISKDKCGITAIIYNMQRTDGDLILAFDDAEKIFNSRILKHFDDDLLKTDFSKETALVLQTQSLIRMNVWREMIKNPIL
jgi:hypothetical protein